MYKHILAPVDGSDISTKALQEAIKLAKNQRAMLRIFHVIDESIVDYAGIGLNYAIYESSVKEYGHKIIKDMSALAKEHCQFETRVIELKAFEGSVEEKIVLEAQEWPADLIVLGTHGRRGLSHLLLGSVAEGVMRAASIPVLLIRGEDTEF